MLVQMPAMLVCLLLVPAPPSVHWICTQNVEAGVGKRNFGCPLLAVVKPFNRLKNGAIRMSRFRFPERRNTLLHVIKASAEVKKPSHNSERRPSIRMALKIRGYKDLYCKSCSTTSQHGGLRSKLARRENSSIIHINGKLALLWAVWVKANSLATPAAAPGMVGNDWLATLSDRMKLENSIAGHLRVDEQMSSHLAATPSSVAPSSI